jgi:hypothetical protein
LNDLRIAKVLQQVGQDVNDCARHANSFLVVGSARHVGEKRSGAVALLHSDKLRYALGIHALVYVTIHVLPYG